MIRVTETSVALLSSQHWVWLLSLSCCYGFWLAAESVEAKTKSLSAWLKWKVTEIALAGFFSSASFLQSVFLSTVHSTGRFEKMTQCESVDLVLCYSTTVDNSVSCCLPFSSYLSAVTLCTSCIFSVPLISGAPQDVLSHSVSVFVCVSLCVAVWVCRYRLHLLFCSDYVCVML